jgi:hypothetical protein
VSYVLLSVLQVRIAAAEQLPALACALGHSATVEQLLPELSELLSDDEVQVRTNTRLTADAIDSISDAFGCN